MVLVNKTRDKTHSLKKTRSVASAVVDFSDIPVALDSYELFSIPEDAIVTDVFLNVTEAFDALTTMDVGFTLGLPIIAAGAADVIGVVALNNANLPTGTGQVVTLTPSALTTIGKVVVIVEYVEYNLSNGDLTKFSATP